MVEEPREILRGRHRLAVGSDRLRGEHRRGRRQPEGFAAQQVEAITLDPEEIVPWAQQQGIDDTDLAALSRNPEVIELIQGVVDKVNAEFAHNYGRQPEDESLMILPVSPGKWSDRFGGGRENAEIQPPLLDIVVPEGRKQETILGEFNQRRKEPVVLLGVVPAEKAK